MDRDAGERVASNPHLSIPNKMGYGIGQVGGQIYRDAPALLLPIYMTTVLGIPPWMAGLAILVPKAWIIACDPLIGAWSDRKRDKWGRSPFLLAGALTASVAFFLMFTAPILAQPWMTALYMMVIFALASTGFSLFSVPYLSVASEASPVSAERTRLLAFRLVFLAVGVALGAGAALPLAHKFGGGRPGFMSMSICLAIVCGATMLTTYLTVRRWPLIAPPEHTAVESGPPQSTMQILLGNKPFVFITSAHFVALVGQSIAYSVTGHFFTYVVHDINNVFVLNGVSGTAVLIAQPAAVFALKVIRKRTLYIMACIAWSIMCLSWVMASMAPSPITGEMSMLAVGIRGFMWGFTNSVYVLITLSLLTDTINRDLEVHQKARGGLFSGVFSGSEKLAFALGPAIAGVILSAFGFIESQGGPPPEQSALAVNAITWCFALIPAAINLASLALFLRFRLPEARDA